MSEHVYAFSPVSKETVNILGTLGYKDTNALSSVLSQMPSYCFAPWLVLIITPHSCSLVQNIRTKQPGFLHLWSLLCEPKWLIKINYIIPSIHSHCDINTMWSMYTLEYYLLSGIFMISRPILVTWHWSILMIKYYFFYKMTYDYDKSLCEVFFKICSKNYGGHNSSCGDTNTTISGCFWSLPCLAKAGWISSPVCNGFLRFTPDLTPRWPQWQLGHFFDQHTCTCVYIQMIFYIFHFSDLLVTTMATGSFLWSTYLHIYIQMLFFIFHFSRKWKIIKLRGLLKKTTDWELIHTKV